MNLAFITGSRSEYGIFKPIIEKLIDTDYDISILAHGVHFLSSYGYTIREIRADNISNLVEIRSFDENCNKSQEFTLTVSSFCQHFELSHYDFVFIIGDRLESYAAALSAHFMKIPIIHQGGGNLTSGSTDDIYRYNITNLSDYHLASSLEAFNRLKMLPNINNNIIMTGSPAISSVKNFLKTPINIRNYIKSIGSDYALITFHSVTSVKENIVEIMKACVSYILGKGCDVLITHPNNDEGSIEILSFIKSIEHHEGVWSVPNLGSDVYYAAINDCKFVIGNSSSGIIEVPYFNKININVGSRQKGRTFDKSIVDVKASISSVISALENNFKNGWKAGHCAEIYGSGDSSIKIKELLHRLDN
jgi:UDP-hydrolysing UDP-N-acetyl-D-glucosamine 2-epimerase